MINQKRYLVTTANEETWKFHQPIIFLGEWCCLYDRKHKWQGLDAIIAKPYGLDSLNRDSDFYNAKSLEEKFFDKFCKLLNYHHKEEYSNRFWQILTGHWFRKTINMLLNRINTLSSCLKNYKISGCSFYKANISKLASLDEASFEKNCGDDIWNNILFSQIIKFFEIDFPIEYIEEKKKISDTSKLLNNKTSFKRKFLKWCCFNYNKISKKFLRKNDAFILNSYLPLKLEIKLEIALKQLPQMWVFQREHIKLPVSLNDYDISTRKKLKNSFIINSDSYIENIICSLVFDLLPVCYLEGFKNLGKVAQNQPWPDQPRFIFTSNNYEADEIFKFWCALKVEQGFKYYVGQHGNKYGIVKNFSPQIEEITSDKFITWGFKKKLPQYIPAFVLKNAGVRKRNYNPKGGLLLIEQHLPHRIETRDTDYEFKEYFNDQKKFTKLLHKDPKNSLTIRLHGGYKLFRWNEEKRWFDFDPKLKLDYGSTNIKKLISNNRLIVHSYNSTGTLETLSQNIPTLIFWQNGFDTIENNSIPYFQQLMEVGIVHLSPESVAKKVNDNWDDVEKWWNQKNLQIVRKNFCDQFARSSNNSISELKKILLK